MGHDKLLARSSDPPSPLPTNHVRLGGGQGTTKIGGKDSFSECRTCSNLPYFHLLPPTPLKKSFCLLPYRPVIFYFGDSLLFNVKPFYLSKTLQSALVFVLCKLLYKYFKRNFRKGSEILKDRKQGVRVACLQVLFLSDV